MDGISQNQMYLINVETAKMDGSNLRNPTLLYEQIKKKTDKNYGWDQSSNSSNTEFNFAPDTSGLEIKKIRNKYSSFFSKK